MAAAWRRLGSALTGRFDGAVLVACEVPRDAPGPPTAAADAQALQSLRAWCLEGAGSLVLMDLAVLAPLQTPAQARRLATLLCLDLDGSWQLLACAGTPGRLALRLRVKLSDAAWWRARRAADPWDTGFARVDAAALSAWPRFRPRRPTLVVLDAVDAEARACIAALQAAQAAFDHPVRVLRLPPGAYMPA